MRSVSISELKARLSKYLREVRRGGEIQILERGSPIARIVGLRGAPSDDRGRFDRLIRAGILRPGHGRPARILGRAPLDLGAADVSGALEEDREDRL